MSQSPSRAAVPWLVPPLVLAALVAVALAVVSLAASADSPNWRGMQRGGAPAAPYTPAYWAPVHSASDNGRKLR